MTTENSGLVVDRQLECDAAAEDAFAAAEITPNPWRGARERLEAAKAEAARAFVEREKEQLRQAAQAELDAKAAEGRALADAIEQLRNRKNDLARIETELRDFDGRLAGDLAEANSPVDRYAKWRSHPRSSDAELVRRSTGVAGPGHFLFGISPDGRKDMELVDRILRHDIPNLRRQREFVLSEIRRIECEYPAVRSISKEPANV